MDKAEPTLVEAWLRKGCAVLIDVREPDEHAREHIAGARLMPGSRLDPSAIRDAAGPAGIVVLHCKGGTRSAEARARCGALAASGVRVVCLAGGIEAWKRAGLPVVTASGAPRLSIMRQVQVIVGAGVLAGSMLAWLVHPAFVVVPAFMGAGLTFAGLTGTCGLAVLLGRMPWNRAASGGTSCGSGVCG